MIWLFQVLSDCLVSGCTGWIHFVSHICYLFNLVHALQWTCI